MTVLDASALLALLLDEPGAEVVAAHLADASISAVNLAEVLGRFARDGHDPAALAERLAATGLEVVPLTARQALRIAVLDPLCRSAGISLGDRACLALAAERRLPAMTADRAWLDLDLGVRIVAIR